MPAHVILAAIAAVVCAGGCWSGAAAPAPVAAHKPHGEASRVAGPYASDLARELAYQLRVTPGELLPQAVQHGVLVLDVARNDVRTVCGDDAIAATEPWSAMLADPARDLPRCFVSANEVFACTQAGRPGEPLLALRFVHADRWELVGAIAGVPQSNAWAAKVDQLDAKVDRVACP